VKAFESNLFFFAADRLVHC